MNSKLYLFFVGLVFVLLAYGTYLALAGEDISAVSNVRLAKSDSPVTLPVDSSAPFAAGQHVVIDAPESKVQETQVVTAVPDATHITVAKLDNAHDGMMDPVPVTREIPWSSPAPTEKTMLDAQRIFYYHVPAATAAYTLFGLNFLASLLYLWKRSDIADAWAVTCAEVGVVFATVVLITGPIWGRFAWNTWWSWEPRLTTFLILWLLYVSYLVLRRSAESGSSSILAAALAVFAFLDVPFSYYANRFRGHHPPPITLGHPAMTYTLMANMIAFLAFAALIVWFRYALERMERRIAAIHIQRAARGVVASVLPAMFLFQVRQNLNPTHFMYAAYIAAWLVYIGYLLLLTRKVARLKREEQDLGRIG
jgi:heme exporter protein C